MTDPKGTGSARDFPHEGGANAGYVACCHGAPFAAAGKSKCPDSHLTSASSSLRRACCRLRSPRFAFMWTSCSDLPGETPALTFDCNCDGSGCRAKQEHDLGNPPPQIDSRSG